MNKLSFKMHPISILYMLSAYWYIFTFPIVRIVLERLFLDGIFRILPSDIVIFVMLFLYVVLKWRSVTITVINGSIEIKNGIFIKSVERIYFNELIGVVTKQNIFDVMVGSVNLYINAFVKSKTRLIISVRNAKWFCKEIYECNNNKNVKIERKITRYFTVPIIIATIILFFTAEIAKFWRKTIYGLAPACVIVALEFYYLILCYYNYRCSQITFGKTVFAKGAKGLKLYKVYCNKNQFDIIRIKQSPIDKYHNTCKISVITGVKVGETLKLRNVYANCADEFIKETYTNMNNTQTNTNNKQNNVSRET